MAAPPDDDMLREAARSRGFRLVKSRRRKPGGDFGRYGLVDLGSGRECMGFGADGLTASAEEVHAYLRGGEVASWKRSLIGIVADEPAEERRSTRAANSDSPPALAGGAGGGSTSPKKGHPQPLRGGAEGSAPKRKSPAVPSPPPAPPPPPPAPPAPLTVRDATRRDAAALARLLGIPAASLAERLAAAIRADEPPLVAERGGMVGCCAWTIVPTLQHGPRGRVTLLLVAEDERRQGIGARLLEEVEQRMADAGVATIEMTLDIDFDAPAAFLRRTGWQRTTNGYGKELG